ncbi:HpcH/HpaI aldolase family protein [Sphingomonas lycopersici]|uniref:HpcH/HpaI aldolase/citrate lyase family protein n=1 Tax=Sphingomonas lycopersici TaxID=2951807 RepID=A0AA41ZEA7_9SPHN|nr:HpcH/HpaI aldolase/citrate lyase family protein [Sphingomonas lycopersici]MCW6535329.1 HpcH/HpaI aldolase/citrate lyase family protein [Sphingomonas lycopersici]
MSAFREWIDAAPAPRLGLWQALASPYTAEICATLGFDWMLFDGEHAPNTAQTLLGQLQAVAPYPVHAIARPPAGDAVNIKQYLDIGFGTLLIPMVESADQAAAIVAASRFPPRGIRGVASSTSRASRFGAETSYLGTAHERTGIIVQIESAAALAAVDEIAAVEGVDGLFIGPADLAASLGHLGNPLHETVQAAIDQAFAAIHAAGKPAGIFALDPEDAAARAAQGFGFISVGTDIGLLANGGRRLLQTCRG